MKKVSERIAELRNRMKEEQIDIYLIPTADFHQSEYVGEHFKVRQYITGFTGSAGTAVITQTEAGLWTDGRYFIQAAAQLEGSGIALRKMGEEGVPTIEEYLTQVLPEHGTLGFDGRTISANMGKKYEKLVQKKCGKIKYQKDLAGEIWSARPSMSTEPAWELDVCYAGESREEKLHRIREKMKKVEADTHLLTSLDDICWTLNIRGNDVKYSPLVLSYLVIKENNAALYVDKNKLSKELCEKLHNAGIEFFDYTLIYEAIKTFPKEESVLMDCVRVNYALYKNLDPKIRVIDQQNPSILMKAMKNQTEIENTILAEIKDGVAHVRFIKWLKENVGREKITEISASDKLEEFRMMMENYIQPSFAPISSFGAHGAIVHYSSTPETDVEIKEGQLFMTDTGAGFLEGTTDITRTYAFGNVPQIMKEHFTIAVRSNLALANARFLEGCTGQNLDTVARQPFWQEGLDFKHGTGHGVGYLMNVHEGPCAFRWKIDGGTPQPLREGMIITDEPGIYIENSHGIRIENELLVCKGEKNEFGQFMYFRPITYVPIDLDAIFPEKMTEQERKLLNNYHELVYKTLSPYLNVEEQEWLKKHTRAI